MHHAHVKRKETTMNRFIIDEYYRDPGLRLRLSAMARRERNRAIRAGFAWLRRRLVPHFDFHPSHWMERLG
jgi:hypothetical protein